MNIFIDLGAHWGESVLHWKRFKGRDFWNWKVYSFEPMNLDWQIKYKNVELIRKAAWIKDGTIKIYPSIGRRKLGSSLCSTKLAVDLDNPVEIPCIDFAIFLEQFRNDYVVLKINIEGAEYDLIPHLYRTKALEIVKEIYVAWHQEKLTDVTLDSHNECLEMLKGIKYKKLEDIQHRYPNMFK